MARYFDIKITTGTAQGPYTVYYNSVNPANIAYFADTTVYATNLTYTMLTTGDGVKVEVPDNITQIILYNSSSNCNNFQVSSPPPPSQTPTPTTTPVVTPTSTPTPTAVDCSLAASFTEIVVSDPSPTPTPTKTTTPTRTPTITLSPEASQQPTPTTTPTTTPCSSCDRYFVGNDKGDNVTRNYYYRSCSGGTYQFIGPVPLADGETDTICACTDSVYGDLYVTWDNQGPCDPTPTPTKTPTVTPTRTLTPTITVSITKTPTPTITKSPVPQSGVCYATYCVAYWGYAVSPETFGAACTMAIFFPVPYYWDTSFGSDPTQWINAPYPILYENTNLTLPVTGKTFVAYNNNGSPKNYTINSSTGQITGPPNEC